MLTPNLSREGTVVRARIDKALKARAEKNLRDIGVSLSDGIRMFLAYAADKETLPFVMKVPNAETRAAIEEARTMRGRFRTPEELFDALDGRPEARPETADRGPKQGIRKGLEKAQRRKGR